MGDPHPTEHRPANRLAHETSPYLLQHAFNPVNWYPWGQEAFDAARARDVPIFLSVGYSTCYWCHVMERESFEDAATGALMNDLFVSIKVDREERPDVDDAYMAATQAMTSSGGWPMSVFLEPKTLKPFWCGTYFPPTAAHGRPSFRQLLEGLSSAWKTQRSEILTQAEQLASAVAERIGQRQPAAPIGIEEPTRAAADLLRIHDRARGGFGSAPKFPQPAYLDFLLTFRAAAGDDETRSAVDSALRHTLDHMALGGVFDQVGGGFHRYSTDAAWLIPHFEKMLYDNALLAGIYAQAAITYHDHFYARAAHRTLDYALREMTDAEGGFFSAQDAEVNHREGQNYLWTQSQLLEALGSEDAGFAAMVYNVPAAGGNFRDPHHPDEPPSNVLALSARPATLAAKLGMSGDEFLERLDRINTALSAARLKRPQPARDDKVLTAWNGLMIGALAIAHRAFANTPAREQTPGRPGRDPGVYGAAATRAASFILRALQTPDGRLRRSFRMIDGAPIAKIDGFLEDYAFLAHGLAQLCRAGLDPDGTFLTHARSLVQGADELFGDNDGGYFDTPADQPDMFIRTRSEYDGAIPAASSVMANTLIDLHELTGEHTYLNRATRLLASASGFIAATPVGAINSTRALLRILLRDPSALSSPGPTGGGGRVRGWPAAPSAGLVTSPGPTGGGGRVREAGGGAPSATTPSNDEPNHEAVTIFAPIESLTVRKNDPAGFVLEVRIQDGYHIAAADPGPDAGPAGLRIDVINGHGVRAYADYPPGQPYTPAWSQSPTGLLVYTGTVSIPVVLEREGDWRGRPLLAVTYQACTDTACPAPVTVELDIAIDRE